MATIGMELQKIQDLLQEIAFAQEAPEDQLLALRAGKAVRDIARGVAPVAKPGKKRGRKPGSKNTPKASATPTEGNAVPKAAKAAHRHEFPTGAVGENCSIEGCVAKKANRGRPAGSKNKAPVAAAPEPQVTEEPADEPQWEAPVNGGTVPLPHRQPGWEPKASVDADDDMDELDR